MGNNYLIVLGHYSHMGGAERQAFHFIHYLRRKRNADVSVLGWFGDGPLAQTLRELGCAIYNFPYRANDRKFRKGLNLFHLALFIRRNIKPDYILPFVSIHSKPICQIWRLTGARYAWWNQQDEGRGLYGTKSERKALLNACHITSNSIAGTQFLSRTYGIPEEKILTYNNGTVLPDLSAIKPIWRERLGVPAAGKLVSMAANVTPFKDHETLLKAWRLVLDGLPSVPLTLALAGHLSDKEHVQRLKVLAFDLNLCPTVKFLGSVDTTNELMTESDIVVHSSVKEGCPNAVCEAMALGKAVVCTDIPGTRQALDRSLWSTCLCEAKNENDLAAKIMHLMENSNKAALIGMSNRRRIESDFSIEGMCEFFESLLDPAHV